MTKTELLELLLKYLQARAPISLPEYFRDLYKLLKEVTPNSDFGVYILAPAAQHHVPHEPRYVTGTQQCGWEPEKTGPDPRFFTRAQINERHRKHAEISIEIEIGLHLDESQFDAALLIVVENPSETLLENKEEVRRAVRSRLLVAVHSLGNLYRSLIVAISLKSRDLKSFLFRVIHEAIIPRFNAEGVSIFYADEDQKQLILGNTSGITSIRLGQAKRSDIRYFIGGTSYTVQSFQSKKIIVEDVNDQSPMHINTHSDAVDKLYSRAYFPLRVYSSLVKREDADGLGGVIRLVNFNSGLGYKPLDVVEAALLSFVAEITAILAKRYVRAMNLIHDQERMTHGYATDLATISLATEALTFQAHAIRRELQAPAVPEDVKIRAITSVDRLLISARNVDSVQEHMAEQMTRVLETQENAFRLAMTDGAICATPYTSVFLRIANIRAGMCKMFNRPDVIITANGDEQLEKNLRILPAIRIDTNTLFSIVRNIVENAIKYSPEGAVAKVDITWTQDKGAIEFRFRDYGIGITPKEEEWLGMEGFRGLEARRLQLRGNGVGHYLGVDKTQHAGGTLRYERPTDNKPGSIFVLTLPVNR